MESSFWAGYLQPKAPDSRAFVLSRFQSFVVWLSLIGRIKQLSWLVNRVGSRLYPCVEWTRPLDAIAGMLARPGLSRRIGIKWGIGHALGNCLILHFCSSGVLRAWSVCRLGGSVGWACWFDRLVSGQKCAFGDDSQPLTCMRMTMLTPMKMDRTSINTCIFTLKPTLIPTWRPESPSTWTHSWARFTGLRVAVHSLWLYRSRAGVRS